MTIQRVLKDGTTHCLFTLMDGTELHCEVRPSTKKEMEINSIPPFIAIIADGVIEPTCAPGLTVEDAVLELADRLNTRYCAKEQAA